MAFFYTPCITVKTFFISLFVLAISKLHCFLWEFIKFHKHWLLIDETLDEGMWLHYRCYNCLLKANISVDHNAVDKKYQLAAKDDGMNIEGKFI